MDVHPVAAGGFASAAPSYARIRPTYARAAIGAVKELAAEEHAADEHAADERSARGAAVLDVAAGTGILSGQLWRAGLSVVALEPLPEMLQQLERTLPGVPALRGVAERLPLRSGAVAAVTVGEAYHWFDAPAFLGESRRVLREGGVLALLWNRRDESVDWVAQYGALVVSERPEGRPYRHDADLPAAVAAAGGFDGSTVMRVPNPRACSPQQLVDRAASTSFVAAAEPGARARVLDRIRELAATHPDLAGRATFDLPYVTELWTWRAT